MQPTSTLALHMKALIYEESGNLVKAREQWRLAAETSALNNHARFKVAQLSAALGLPVPETPAYLYKAQETQRRQMAVQRDVQ